MKTIFTLAAGLFAVACASPRAMALSGCASRSPQASAAAHASSATGRIVLDDGAVVAVVSHRTSLLPVGITRIEGRFTAGDTVDLCDDRGLVVARGLVGYDAEELRPLVGQRLARGPRLRNGAPAPRPVVRRDDLVVL